MSVWLALLRSLVAAMLPVERSAWTPDVMKVRIEARATAVFFVDAINLLK